MNFEKKNYSKRPILNFKKKVKLFKISKIEKVFISY